MIDVDRIRHIATKRKEQGLVGMILSVDQVLGLIGRGDGVVYAYKLRIQDLEREIARLRGHAQEDALRALYEGPEQASDSYRTTAEIANLCDVAESTVCRWARMGWVTGEKRKVTGLDGIPRDTWYIDPEEAQIMAALSGEDRREIFRGDATLEELMLEEALSE
jgi:hypothetical protein